ncbi:YmfQ family protein [Sneathiella sp.]|uniref:YmfQ family protein n=1 Tax=Sneathiella sp. TaxID=1964365 RepID=UPI002FE31D56
MREANAKDYARQIRALLPPGPAWLAESGSKLYAIVSATAKQFAAVHEDANKLVSEVNPLFSFDLLPDWEKMCGLPDTCTGSNTTLQERRNAVLEKLNRRGGQSIAYYRDLAAGIGYHDLEIEEFRPSICGEASCGEDLGGQPDVVFYWRVAVPDPRTTFARCGESVCGDYFGKITRAEDLECTLNRLKPSHTTLIFAYEGSA